MIVSSDFIRALRLVQERRLTLREVDVYLCFFPRPGTVSKASEKLGVSTKTVNGICNRLGLKGLVRRTKERKIRGYLYESIVPDLTKRFESARVFKKVRR